MVSILFIICSLLFIGSLSVIVSSKTENIVEAAIVATAYLFCAVGIVGAVYEVTHLPVYLTSICVGVGIVDIFFIAFIVARKKQGNTIYQKEKNDCRYLLSVCVLIGFVLFMCLYHFGLNLKLNYGDVDAVRYFTYAMDIVKTRSISGEFVTPLWISIFIQLIQPIQQEVFLYRGMILENICMQILVAVCFFSLVNKVNEYRNIVNIIITILFWCGYQLYILSYGTFLHWQDGILLIMFIIYHILMIWEQKLKYGIIGCVFGTFVLALCYPFFGFILIALVLPEIIMWLQKREKIKNIPRWKKNIFIFIVVGAMVIAIVFMKQKIPDIETLLYNFSTEGLAYKEPYMDFLFFIPIIVLHFLLMINKKYTPNVPKTVFRMNIMAILFVVCWYVFYVKGYLSNYYLYRNYYVLWLLAWLTTAQVIGILLKKKQALLVGMYGAIYGLCILVSVIGLDEKIYNYNSDLYLNNPSNRTMTPLYSFNAKSWYQSKDAIISTDMYNICQYRIEKLKDKRVLLVSSRWKEMENRWYNAIFSLTEWTDLYNVDENSFVGAIEWLESYPTKYVLIDKTDPILQQYVTAMNKYWDIEVETDQISIYKRPIEGWNSIFKSFKNTSGKIAEFENYVRYNYGYNQVMLLCEAMYNGRGDVTEYHAYEGEQTTKYVGQFEPETFIQNTYIFNNDNIQYLAIYKDSELYLKNEQYFKNQTVLYDNDIAMIVTYSGEGWMPNQ